MAGQDNICTRCGHGMVAVASSGVRDGPVLVSVRICWACTDGGRSIGVPFNPVMGFEVADE